MRPQPRVRVYQARPRASIPPDVGAWTHVAIIAWSIAALLACALLGQSVALNR